MGRSDPLEKMSSIIPDTPEMQPTPPAHPATRTRHHLAVQPTGVDPLLDRIERVAGRLTLAVIVATLVNALTILAAAYHLAHPIQDMGMLVAAGTGANLVLALLLWWNVARVSRR